jgi:hypothetical protein
MLSSLLAALADPNLWLASLLLVLVMAVAVLPWVWGVDSAGMWRTLTTNNGLLTLGGVLLAATVGVAVVLSYSASSKWMTWGGRTYGIILQLNLLASLFVLGPKAVTLVFPKLGAVAQAAYRECWRQPLFWLVLGGAKGAMWLFVTIPYFTFGDDYKMMKQIAFDLVMIAPLLFGALAASISVSEEIEGRTAVTVMSKPISRRSFLLGKFFGVLMACGAMSLLLTVTLNSALLANRAFDTLNDDRAEKAEAMTNQVKKVVVPAVVQAMPPAPRVRPEGSPSATPQLIAPGTPELARGAGLWLAESFTHLFGVLLGFGQVMILVAVATALATRLHFVLSLIAVVFVYLFGHLAPVVATVADANKGGNAGAALVGFLARVFDVILPALEYFNLGPAIIRDTPLEFAPFAIYSLTVFGYSVVYTAIALIVGLLLFEDRDLG